MSGLIEDIRYSVFEFISDLFETCQENLVVMKLMTNALLNYCYLPCVVPALVGTRAVH